MMSSSPSGKASGCNPLTEGSTPSEDSVRESMLRLIKLQIDTLTKLILERKLSIERMSEFYRLRKRSQNLYNWIEGGGDPTPNEVKKWLR